jgi:hypothetical protein
MDNLALLPGYLLLFAQTSCNTRFFQREYLIWHQKRMRAPLVWEARTFVTFLIGLSFVSDHSKRTLAFAASRLCIAHPCFGQIIIH